MEFLSMKREINELRGQYLSFYKIQVGPFSSTEISIKKLIFQCIKYNEKSINSVFYQTKLVENQ
jgi:hypothetical protein